MKTIASKLAIKISQCHAVPYKYRMSLIRRIYPKLLLDYPFESNLLELKFAGNTRNVIDRMIYLTGAFEKHILYFLRDIVSELRKNNVHHINFMDVGANVGNHSLYLATLADNVYAFEPFARVREQFANNVELNQLKNIRIFPFGLGKEPAILPFYAGPDSNLGSASFVGDHSNHNTLIGELEVRNGDEVVQQEKLYPINLMKIDVEGFEKNVLEGLHNTILQNRPLIILEMSATAISSFNNSEQEIRSAFPPDYQFYYFSSGNYNTGKYQLSLYDFFFHYKHQDVIACPNELNNIVNSLIKRKN
jgi:FkbM family methyltransferase